MFSAYCALIDQSEDFDLFLIAGAYVGADRGSTQTLKGFDKGLVVFATCAAIGEDQKLMGIDTDARVDLFASVQLRHQLRDCVDQQILVVDRCEALHRGRDLEPVIAVAILADRGAGLL